MRGASLHRESKGKKTVLVGIVAVVAVVLAIGAGALFGGFSGSSVSIERAGGEGSVDSASEGALSVEEGTPANIVVHVSGAVANGGVYELPEGSRAGDAVEAAGGFAEGAAAGALNLARVVSDGEQINVPFEAEMASGAASEGSSSSGGVTASSGKVNINTAGVAELDTLPGVGVSTAQKIIADREANGSFARPEDLMRVAGIGEKKFEQLAALIVV